MGSHPTWLELAASDDGVYEAGAGAALFDDALAAAVRQLRAAAFAAPRPLSLAALGLTWHRAAEAWLDSEDAH